MNAVISIADVSPADRLDHLQAMTEGMLAELRPRFPEVQGYRYRVQERLAKWAWPRGTNQSEKQIIAALDSATRERAFRRGIRVTRGLTWGLTMDIQTTDREMNGVKLTVLSESPLTVIVGLGGFIGGIVLSFAYAVARVPDWSRGRNVKLALYAGMAIGAVLGALGWLIARPLEGLKPEAAKELMGTMNECVTRPISSIR